MAKNSNKNDMNLSDLKTGYNPEKYPLVSYEDSKTTENSLPTPLAEDKAANIISSQELDYKDKPAVDPNLEHEDEW